MARDFSIKTVVMLSILIFFFSLIPVVLSTFNFVKLPLPSTAMGPTSIVFDLLGEGPYTGVSDGRILKYQQNNGGFVDFAFTAPNRSSSMCDGITDPDSGPVCGRPLGLGFNYRTGELYIADAYFGLLVVGREGKLATQLATTAEGVPFNFLNSLDVDPQTGTVYFTDASSTFKLSNVSETESIPDGTGRLLKYDPKTKNVTVLIRGISRATGTAVSSDGTFVLASEFIGERIDKLWLKGEKANTKEILVSFEGRPTHIRRTASGDFWVAVNIENPSTGTHMPTAIRINAFGTILKKIPLDAQFNTMRISEIQEFGGAHFVGSLFTNFLGKYKIFEQLS